MTPRTPSRSEFDSSASMPWSRMPSDPILSVSPSVTEAKPEMPAPAGATATRTRERKAANGRSMNESSRAIQGDAYAIARS